MSLAADAQDARNARTPLRENESPPQDTTDGVQHAAIVAAAILGGLSLVALAALLRKGWPLGMVALYSRLNRVHVLAHPTRQRILTEIRREPGIRLAELRERLGLARSVVTHHVDKLAASGFIFTAADGLQRRAYAVDHGFVPDVAALDQRILTLLRAGGPLATREAARTLSVSRQALHYHVKRLERAGHLRVERRAFTSILHPVAAPREEQ